MLPQKHRIFLFSLYIRLHLLDFELQPIILGRSVFQGHLQHVVLKNDLLNFCLVDGHFSAVNVLQRLNFFLELLSIHG